MTRVIATAAQGPDSPAFRIRIAQLSDRLAAVGVDVAALPLFDAGEAAAFAGGSALRRARVLLGARRSLRARLAAAAPADTAFVQRHVDMLPGLALERTAVDGRRLVLDVDDAAWLEGPSTGGHPLARLKRGERKLRWLASRADRVQAGNELLAEHLGHWSRNVSVVPSLVDVERVAVREHDDTEAVTLGWIGSPTTSAYLRGAAPALEAFAASSRRPVRLLVVGGRTPVMRGVEVHEIAWSEAAERDALARIDIGLMPLPDTAWTRGKCAYKALQYMAAGVPVLADDVGVTARVIASGGIAVKRRGEWVDALHELAGSAGLRAQLGSRGREQVEREFSVTRWLPQIAAALRGD